MKKRFSTITFLFFVCTIIYAQNSIDRVNPMIGTGSMGHVFPGATIPHGIVALSPDTDTIPHNISGKYQPRAYEYCSGYQYGDNTIVGFSHTHFSGTGHSDLGDILIMPTVGELKLTPGTSDNPDSGYRSRFSHNDEIAHPGYYSVLLQDYAIKAELTATERVGVHKYTYGGQQGRVILDLIHAIYNYDGKVLWASVTVESPTLLTGYRITNGWARENYQYFAIEFSQPIIEYGYQEYADTHYSGMWRKFNLKKNFPQIAGRKIRSYFEFGNLDELIVKVALSAVSTQGALKNLREETGNKSFSQLVQEASQKWSKALEVIEASGSEDQLAMLYTSLYHTMINPSIYQDVDGNYRGLDGNIHQVDNFTNYTIFSLWDTYRALHPLYNIINRQRNKDICLSMLAHSDQSVYGILPIWSHMANENWCMIGYHGVSVLGDAIAKGVIPADGDEAMRALNAMIASSNFQKYDNTSDYIKYGYVPFDLNSNGVSITLEFSYDDWVIYNTAKKMRNNYLQDSISLQKIDSIIQQYYERAHNYRNIFDPSMGFARAKNSDGSWKKPFSLLNTSGEGFIEGNSWNYSFYVPQNIEDLISLMGGNKEFETKLDSLFTMHLAPDFFAHTEDVTEEGLIGNYVHGNEPSHHIVYLYNWTSNPKKGQYWIREIMNTKYRNEINGLCGNDDCGQMSAWYIFTAMGFYPVCPGSDQLVFGAPYLPYMKINLENGNTFEIKAPKVSDKNRFVRSIRLNGKKYTKRYITNDDILKGGVLEFDMTDK